MRGTQLLFKKSSCDYGDAVPKEVTTLLDELYEVNLDSEAWQEVYEYVLRKLPQLRAPYQVLAAFYRAIRLRADYLVATRVVGKFLKNFSLLFEKTELAKLSGDSSMEKDEYYVPTLWCIWLFQQLISREDAEVKANAEAGQLSLITFLNTPPKGVRA